MTDPVEFIDRQTEKINRLEREERILYARIDYCTETIERLLSENEVLKSMIAKLLAEAKR